MDYLIRILLISINWILSSSDNNLQDFCQWEIFKPSCPEDHVIFMKNALYGRMEFGRCVNRDYGYVGCSSDVLKLMDARCSGSRSCSVSIPDKLLDIESNCPDDIKMYLQASYSCLEVNQPDLKSCVGMRNIKPTHSSGYLVSKYTHDTSCGSTEVPWLLWADEGQRINLTLLDFGLAPSSINGSYSTSPHCHVYAIIKEITTGQSMTICGGESRIKNVYISSSNSVEIRIMTSSTKKERRSFMIKYETLGCADLTAPLGGWVERLEDTLRIGCNGDSEIYKLVCNGTMWLGKYKNCSAAFSPAAAVKLNPLGTISSIAVIICVSVLVGICILVVGLVSLWRKQHNNSPSTAASKALQIDDKSLYHSNSLAENHPQYRSSKPRDSTLYKNSKQDENEYAYIDEFPNLNKSFPPFQSVYVPDHHNVHLPNMSNTHIQNFQNFNMDNTPVPNNAPQYFILNDNGQQLPPLSDPYYDRQYHHIINQKNSI